MDYKLKVCGMKDPGNIWEVVEFDPDYLGFIFYPSSPRYFDIHSDPETIRNIPAHIQKIGVFVNEHPEVIISLAEKFQLQGIQLHGNETLEVCRLIKLAGYITIKAFAIDNNTDFSELKEFEDVVDYYLFDTKTPLFGGSGKTFDWQILNNYHIQKPYFLSGGISLEHAGEIRNLTGYPIHAIDINSRFEIQPGLKDVEKIKDFKEKLRGKFTT